MTGVCIGLKPQNIEDITAIIALYRPGPMESIPRFIECKQHPEKITYLHPSLQPILGVTYGCIVYQEQVIEIFRKLGGYSLGQADMVRRAISKKKAKEIEKEKNAFIHGDAERNISGCVNNGIPEPVAEAIYKEIYDFANYAFNKAHAVSYAVVAYQTAYFKCHYTKEYMAALLTSVLDNSDKVAEYIAECKECGIRLLPPDINFSRDSFTVEEQGIRFGLVAIKNIGRGFIQAVMREREEKGRFTSLQSFCERMYGTDMNKRALENLILSVPLTAPAPAAPSCTGFMNRCFPAWWKAAARMWRGSWTSLAVSWLRKPALLRRSRCRISRNSLPRSGCARRRRPRAFTCRATPWMPTVKRRKPCGRCADCVCFGGLCRRKWPHPLRRWPAGNHCRCGDCQQNKDHQEQYLNGLCYGGGQYGFHGAALLCQGSVGFGQLSVRRKNIADPWSPFSAGRENAPDHVRRGYPVGWAGSSGG